MTSFYSSATIFGEQQACCFCHFKHKTFTSALIYAYLSWKKSVTIGMGPQIIRSVLQNRHSNSSLEATKPGLQNYEQTEIGRRGSRCAFESSIVVHMYLAEHPARTKLRARSEDFCPINLKQTERQNHDEQQKAKRTLQDISKRV